jgi:hypothetical protein
LGLRAGELSSPPGGEAGEPAAPASRGGAPRRTAAACQRGRGLGPSCGRDELAPGGDAGEPAAPASGGGAPHRTAAAVRPRPRLADDHLVVLRELRRASCIASDRDKTKKTHAYQMHTKMMHKHLGDSKLSKYYLILKRQIYLIKLLNL